jgi:hypothetical protein
MNATEAKKSAHFFILRIAEGMAGWASFAQAANRSAMYSESLLYLPIFELGTARGWIVRPQGKLAKEQASKGRRSTIDFVFRSDADDIGILLEVKFDRYKTNHCLQITKDARKLTKTTREQIWKRGSPTYVFKFIMVIGRKNKILERTEDKARDFSNRTTDELKSNEDIRLLSQMRKAFANTERQDSASVGWGIPGIGGSTKNWVLLLEEAKWWGTLAELPPPKKLGK